MKLLLTAAIRNSKHLTLAILTLTTLLLATLANQMEMFSLGLMANSGTDISKLNESNPLNWLYKKILANFEIERHFLLLIMILVCVALFKALLLFVSRYTTQILSIRLTRDLRLQYFEHIQGLPLGFYQEYNTGSLTSRVIGDAGQIASSINSLLTNYLQTPFTIVSTLCVCFYLSWKLSLVIFIGLPLIIMPVVVLTRRIKKVSKLLQKNQEKFTSVLLDFLAGIHTIKIFAREKFSLQKYTEQNHQMAHLESKNAKYCLMTRPILHTITTACLAIVCLFGLYTLHMTVSQLLVFCGLLHLFYEPVKKFAEENANIQRGVVAAERMFEVLHLKPNIEDAPDAKQIETFTHAIEFKDVSFKYNHDWVLKDLSFKVKRGETIAIVGPTGAGKSTIVQLIPRLFDIQQGEIRIDGLPIKGYTQQSLRELIAFVPQRPFLFYDTVAENIAFGKTYPRAEIVEAAKKAHADEFIVNLPEQYDTLLAETGKTLSGGQQQRLAIARALVKKSPILILDEATSSLDAISENKIRLAIAALHGEVTQIIIAHRLSTIDHADRIIYLDEGKKIAEGTKDELLKNCPPFRLMWETFHRLQK